MVEIRRRADDAVELRVELELALEHAPMQLQIGRRFVREVHAVRSPVRAEQRRTQTKQHADRELRALA